MVKPIVPIALLSIAVLTNAHAHGEQRRHDIHARQNPPPGQPSASANPSAPAGSASPGKPSLTFSLATSNPTAIPLASITGGAPQRQTLALASTVQAGAVPTLIVGAPPLPDRLALNPLDYPTGDQIPPTDSREVDIWWDEIVNSGVQIPDFEPTHPAVPPQGNCEGANAAFAADPNRCWWTCGGCVTVDDIDECNDKNHWGLTFDDGPANYTSNLLHYLDEVQLKATFFVVGSRVTAFPATLQAQYAGGHQIGIHTWSHKALTTLSNREIVAELGWTKKVIYDTLGVTPNMMRPPYGDIDNRVRAISLAMGLTPVMWTRAEGQVFNTEDFDINGGKPVETILNKWQSILSTIPLLNKGFITLQHDLYQEFVDMATGYIIPGGLAVNPRLTIEPVSTCTGRRLADAYIETNDNSSFPLKARLGVHTPGGPADRGSGDRVVASAVAAFSLLGATGLLAGWLL